MDLAGVFQKVPAYLAGANFALCQAPDHISIILIYSIQIASTLIWKMPLDEFSSALDNLKQPTEINLLKGNETELNAIFRNEDIFKMVFPNKVFLRDGESFMVGPTYASNVNKILRGFKHITLYFEDLSCCRSLSFGSAMTTGKSIEICRYWIDYYGDAEFDLFLAHFRKHAKQLLSILTIDMFASMSTRTQGHYERFILIMPYMRAFLCDKSVRQII